MEKSWPYQIDAIPLQFGSSQVTRVTAQFKYERHYTITRNVRNAAQATKGEFSEGKLFGYETVAALTDAQKLEKLKQDVKFFGNKNLARRMVDTFPMGE